MQSKTNKEGSFVSDRRLTVALLLVLLLGAAMLLYPGLSDYWNSLHQTRAIMRYTGMVAEMNAEKYAELLKNAKDYNTRLTQTGIRWETDEERLTDYNSQLSFDEDGNMGYIDIPKINVKLPIFHGTSAKVLNTSIGHLEETSLPVGGKGSHCVLSGHRGLPSARLFSDLDKLTEGDTFTLSILNETFTYEVDRIRVVLPSDMSELKIVPGQDLCTLVTCTPYGINSHRLLVRGHRVANAQGDALVVADALQLEAGFVAPFIMVPMIVILLLLMFILPGVTALREKAIFRGKAR